MYNKLYVVFVHLIDIIIQCYVYIIYEITLGNI